MLTISFLSTIIVLVMGIFILVKIKNRKQIHYIFLLTILCEFLWCLSLVIAGISVITQYKYEFLLYLELYIMVLGISFFPIMFLFLCIIFKKNVIKFNSKYLLLFISPVINVLLFITNKYHHLSFKNIHTYEWGAYFIFNMVFSYICIIIGFIYLIYFSLKNAGYFSNQVKLIIIGSAVPFVMNILSVIMRLYFPQVSQPFQAMPVSIAFTMVCYAFAIFKHDFLNVAPIALQNVVDRISDSYVIIDEEYSIIDYNRAFEDTFGRLMAFKRKDSLIDIIKKNQLIDFNADELSDYIMKAVKSRKSELFENHIQAEGFDQYFSVEITPIFSGDIDKKGREYNKYEWIAGRSILIGIIILYKDITEHKNNIEALKEQQEILLEQERLASLGQLIGGIAHNLKTPIMSISGGIEALKDLAYEYRDSIDDRSVTEQDHKEIAKEMLNWLDRMKPYCSYMSDVISAVKGQAVQMNASTTVKFTVDELVKRVDLLMRHELKKYHCILNLETQIDMSTEIKGEVNNLVQVFDNIIINAMQAYEGQNGTIDLKILRSGDNVEFTFRDYGKGIPKQITDRLFKEMVTTKGKNGTGLGLYMSYSTIKGRFGGNMSFTSKEGCGTTFFISIPCITYSNQEAG